MWVIGPYTTVFSSALELSAQAELMWLVDGVHPTVSLLTLTLTKLNCYDNRFPFVVSRHLGGLATSICPFFNQVQATYFMDFIGQSSLLQCISIGTKFTYSLKGFLWQFYFQYATWLSLSWPFLYINYLTLTNFSRSHWTILIVT